jgi:hypothetical protein
VQRLGGRLGALAAATVLTACGDAAPPAPTAAQQTTSVPAVPAPVTNETVPAHPVGEPFTLGDLRLTVLSVQDPFPGAAATQPAPGNRLVSIRYEVASLRAETLHVTDLPVMEVGDATGGTYTSEHGRLSSVNGMRRPGDLPAGTWMEASALVEVPASAAGLRATFRARDRPDVRAVVRLD